MKNIKTIAELRAEKARLQMELLVAEEKMKDDFEWIKEELSPVKAAGKMLGKAVVNKNQGIVSDGVNFAVNTLIKNLLLARAGWVTKLVVPFVIKNISSNFIGTRQPEILGMIKNFIHKARKATHSENGTNEKHYDKSTAHEMGY